VIAGVLGRAGQIGQERRVADAKQGVVKWSTSSDILRFTLGQLSKAKNTGASVGNSTDEQAFDTDALIKVLERGEEIPLRAGEEERALAAEGLMKIDVEGQLPRSQEAGQTSEHKQD
jgi:hypothetical protein